MSLLAASSAFFLLHLLPATPLRPRLIGVAGEPVYAAIFSIASAGRFGGWCPPSTPRPMGKAMGRARCVALAQSRAGSLRIHTHVGGVATPNPSAPGGDKVLEKGNAAAGIFAITRHPLMWGIAIWAIAHMISQPNLRGFVFFGGFAATALIGSYLQQRRKRAQLAGWPAFEAKTSFVPFAAILEGRAALSLKAIGWSQIAIAAVLWAVILHFHASWFGAQPLPW